MINWILFLSSHLSGYLYAYRAPNEWQRTLEDTPGRLPYSAIDTCPESEYWSQCKCACIGAQEWRKSQSTNQRQREWARMILLYEQMLSTLAMRMKQHKLLHPAPAIDDTDGARATEAFRWQAHFLQNDATRYREHLELWERFFCSQRTHDDLFQLYQWDRALSSEILVDQKNIYSIKYKFT